MEINKFRVRELVKQTNGARTTESIEKAER